MLTALRLPTFRQRYEEVSRYATNETLSYEQFLYELVREEYQERQDHRIERNLRQSRLPLGKTLDSFDMGRMPRKIQQQSKNLLTGNFIEHQENILAFGQPGTGKTHLLCGIAQNLIHTGYSVRFYSCSLLVQDLLNAKKKLELAKMINALGKYDVLVIDDIGYVQQSREEMEVLFTLLAERYERRSVMITSNLPFSKWEMIFKDPMTTAAAIDRLVHHSVILELNIPSFRLEASKANQVSSESLPDKEKNVV
jgi:DNA replication protein DnaC